MREEGLICWNCGRPTGLIGGVTRSDSCPRCLADMRCCRGCRFFDPHSRFHCRESIDTNIPNKEKSNFCGWFQMRDVIKRPGGIRSKTDPKEERRKSFDDLFED